MKPLRQLIHCCMHLGQFQYGAFGAMLQNIKQKRNMKHLSTARQNVFVENPKYKIHVVQV